MDNIYSFLKNLWEEINRESKKNISFFFAILFVITIPLSLGINNICLVLLLITLVVEHKKASRLFSKSLIYPIVLFVIMCFSYLWSIDQLETLKAIPKSVVLVLLPLVFLLFNPFSAIQIEKVKQYYSYAIVVYVLYFLLRAIIRFVLLKDSRVFYYHGDYNDDFGLVPKVLNAIHFSVFVSLAYFYFITKDYKSVMRKMVISILFLFIILLSSKNIILVFLVLNLVYFFFYSKAANKMRIRNLILLVAVMGMILFFGKIKQRFQEEFKTNTKRSIAHNVLEKTANDVHYVSIKEAWTNEKFTPNDFFPGTAFRVYQIRVFLELLKEEPIFWKGFGLNASYPKLEEKGKSYNVFLGDEKNEGYQKKNFHNQYLQIFSELGILGLVCLLVMVVISLKNGIINKDFVHIAFSILMISLFLTESFLSRQRGIVFFTLFYCLFNTNTTVKENNKL